MRDSTEKEFSEALAWLRQVLAAVSKRTAVLILHHIHKPKSEDRHSGRSLSFLAERAPRRGLVVLLTDLWDPNQEETMAALKHFRHRAQGFGKRA